MGVGEEAAAVVDDEAGTETFGAIDKGGFDEQEAGDAAFENLFTREDFVGWLR